ncbi:MAG: hypothetical protein IBJ18_12400 [Phycisphaerales bacterium]|nr:hypothetical protein [Phycisphaerales bacterium]
MSESDFARVWAVVRVDYPDDFLEVLLRDTEFDWTVKVHSLHISREAALEETTRLNALQAEKHCRYHLMPTKIDPEHLNPIARHLTNPT